MKSRVFLVLALLFIALMGGTVPSPFQRGDVRDDLAVLAKRGFSYRMVERDLIELTDPVGGEKQIKSLREPNDEDIRAWASERSVPILEIDPNTIDTNQYTGWYVYWAQLPISNGLGTPLVIGDVDRNGRADIYGDSRVGLNFAAHIYEVDTNGASSLRYTFDPRPGVPRELLDADEDSLVEVAFGSSGLISDFE